MIHSYPLTVKYMRLEWNTTGVKHEGVAGTKFHLVAQSGLARPLSGLHPSLQANFALPVGDTMGYCATHIDCHNKILLSLNV